MLVPRNQFSSSLRRVSGRARHYSSSHATIPYHSKVRVYPFRISPEDAVRNMSLAAAIPFVGHFLRSLLARWLPGFWFQPIQPVQLQALYLPAWLIDTELTGTAWIGAEHEDEERRSVVAIATNSYMPGHSLEPISRICLNNPQLYEAKIIPWSPELETQYGLQTLCLPFTMSPFGLHDLLRSLSYRDAAINANFRLDPKSIETTLLAAYPVLIPVYLARYEYKVGDETFNLTVLQEAYHRQGRVISENSSVIFAKALSNQGVDVPSFAKDFMDRELLVWRAKAVPFACFEFLYASGAFSRPQNKPQLVEDINEWINTMADAPGSFQRLARREEMQRVDMDDLRVRTYDEEEVAANRIWMALGVTERNLQSMIARWKKTGGMSLNIDISTGLGKRDETKPDNEASEPEARSSSETKVGPISITKYSQEDSVKNFERHLVQVKAEREEKKPEWLKNLHAKNKKECSDR
ncbi:hypothetical protein OE88DRAFT_1665494 [Heliocybe sulcata]|uniref:Uncharacterized protein n=1 Tax=Heliocybe sulcata TaxID=5364 RepID=A0A5C3MST6_9AGAM|nr:hypothetical protein OE88DRAFT_1665494 [Heliocybe sulcata]